MRRALAGIIAMTVAGGAPAGAEASQVGILDSGGGQAARRSAVFTAAPWEANTVTMAWLDDGRTVVFHDSTGVIGANPPAGQGRCTRIDTHQARCTSPWRFTSVTVSLGDAGSSYQDLAGSPGPWPIEFVSGGLGNDRIEVDHATYWTRIDDLGGTNSFRIGGAAVGEIDASNGWADVLDVRNGHAGDIASCDVRAAPGSTVQDPLLPGDVNGRVLSDAGDQVSGCGTVLG